MKHYAGVLERDEITDWEHAVTEWNTPVEYRIHCDCESGNFIKPMELNDDEHAPFFTSCDDCGKMWCNQCGEPKGARDHTSVYTPSVHSSASNPDICRDTRIAKVQKHQKPEGHTKGATYQSCPMCHRLSTASDLYDVQCEGCATSFCFICGKKHPEQDWVPGLECTWNKIAHHP